MAAKVVSHSINFAMHLAVVKTHIVQAQELEDKTKAIATYGPLASYTYT